MKKTLGKPQHKSEKFLKNSFAKFGFAYYNPHSFRDTLSLLGKKSCTLEQYQAWSQNLGHSKISTTLDEYGGISKHKAV